MAVQCQGTSVFELVHEDTTITYTPGAYGSESRLTYSGPLGHHSFRGDEIQAHESARGLEVKVSMERVSHLRMNTLTLFVPDLALEGETELSFQTVGIHATHRRTLTGGTGATLTSEPLEFHGMARLVEFRAAESPQLL